MNSDKFAGYVGCLVAAGFFVILPLSYIIYHGISGEDDRMKNLEKRQDSLFNIVSNLKVTDGKVEKKEKVSVCEECDYSDESFTDRPVYVIGGRYAKCYHTDINCPVIGASRGKIIVKDEFNLIGILPKCKTCEMYGDKE